MTINPETLKTARRKFGLSQQNLADRTDGLKGKRVSKRQISRIETGETKPDKVRHHTIESLAEALEMKADDLCKGPVELSDEYWRKLGYVSVKVRFSNQDRLNYQSVFDRYDLSFDDLVAAAPWMFQLLAEMSLAERRKRVDEVDAAFEHAMSLLPMHLSHGAAAHTFFDPAVRNERDSIKARDVFGIKLIQMDESFERPGTNPFVDFLERAAQDLASDEIEAEALVPDFSGKLPNWPIFHAWLSQITGGDDWAWFAARNVRINFARMPDEIKSDDKTAERIAWLVAKIPPEVRAEEERRGEDAKAKDEARAKKFKDIFK